MNKIALVGASGHGKVVAEVALMSGWKEVVFFDDAWPEKTSLGGWRIEGNTASLLATLQLYTGVAVSIGDCSARWDKHLLLKNAGARLETVVHPRATISASAKLGSGSVVMAGAVINADARLGEACVVNSGAIVEHDCVLGDCVHVAPGVCLSGAVSVGDLAWIGVGAVVRQGMRLGARAYVGAGAVVVKPVADGCVVVGNPARPFSR